MTVQQLVRWGAASLNSPQATGSTESTEKHGWVLTVGLLYDLILPVTQRSKDLYSILQMRKLRLNDVRWLI